MAHASSASPHGAAPGGRPSTGSVRSRMRTAAVITAIVSTLGLITWFIPSTPAPEKTQETVQTKAVNPPAPERFCGTDGQPDCVCQGDTRVTRILGSGESIYVSAQGPTGFAPSPAPDTFALCNPNTGKCVTSRREVIYTNTTYLVKSRSKQAIRLYCKYHD